MEITSLTFYPRHTRITVRFRHSLYSGQVPELQRNLLAMMPSLRDHLCDNRRGLSFIEELADTELGHVFEHLILELLRHRQIYTHGQTTWNWQRDPIGTYRISIHTGKKLYLKESVLVAQAILTNALLGPAVKVAMPDIPVAESPARLPLLVGGAGGRLLFAAGHQPLEP